MGSHARRTRSELRALAALGGVLLLGSMLMGLWLAHGMAESSPGPHGRFPAPAAARQATIWAVGDGADGSTPARRVARMIQRARPRRLLYLGDIYEDGSALQFQRNYNSVYGAMASITLPTPGNHDWPAHGSGYDRYWSRVTGLRPPDYYRVGLAGWDILSLNSERGLEPGSSQMRWLREQLAGGGSCRLAFWHRPRVSAGKKDDEGAEVAPLWSAVEGRVALVLNGHDHNLQQLRSRGGTTQLIAGAGGHSRYRLDRLDPRLAWGTDRVDGALRIELSPGLARFAFVSASGRVLRRGSVPCRR